MSVIAHWIEQHGIHTVVIGLVKLHLEKIKPPRALWVPFELGRPLGAPADAEFQTDVLMSALKMIETESKQPCIVDYEHEDPRAQTDSDWTPPDTAAATTVVDEMKALQQAYQQHCVSRSRTSVGVAKIPIAESAKLVDALTDQGLAESPRAETSTVLISRLAIDDLKAYYLESALANGNPNSRQVQDWFWQQTYLGGRIRKLRLQWMKSDNSKLATLGERFLVPHRWRDPA